MMGEPGVFPHDSSPGFALYQPEVFAHVTCQDLQDTAICPDWQVPSAGVEEKTHGEATKSSDEQRKKHPGWLFRVYEGWNYYPVIYAKIIS